VTEGVHEQNNDYSMRQRVYAGDTMIRGHDRSLEGVGEYREIDEERVIDVEVPNDVVEAAPNPVEGQSYRDLQTGQIITCLYIDDTRVMFRVTGPAHDGKPVEVTLPQWVQWRHCLTPVDS